MAAIIPMLFGGCSKTGTVKASDVKIPDNITLPGELAGIIREKSEGSMNPDSEYYIEMHGAHVDSCIYYSGNTRKEQSDFDVKQSTWDDLVKITTILYPLMKEVPEYIPGESEERPQVLDGGEKDGLVLIWRTEDGEKAVRYYPPSDRRLETLDTLLEEAANPKGRRIVWYEAPKIIGVYFHDDEKGYSYQMTEHPNKKRMYWIVNYPDKNESFKSIDLDVNRKEWPAVAEFLDSLGLTQFPTSFRGPVECTLYMDDGTQITVTPDEATMENMRSYFKDLIERVSS